MTVVESRLMTVEEYIQYELKSERRHEFINGQLFEMPGEKALNNRKAGLVYQFLIQFLSHFEVYWNDIKVAIPDANRFYYPDLFATREIETKNNEYIKYQPELIVEVVSKSTRTKDMVDKYLDYIKIPSLKYYLIIEPERMYVTVHSREKSGEWDTEVYSERTDIIPLPLLQTELPLSIIYR